MEILVLQNFSKNISLRHLKGILVQLCFTVTILRVTRHFRQSRKMLKKVIPGMKIETFIQF